ncbi:viroplasmin family protein [Succinispira mobilis]|uniref:ribonuclease H1 domain-containing protein n=1 Tax=Succinispira mobilis TaxID=78120 RepID=UPI000366EC0A|nr:ribonuclease H family protein [Succinispira mobilis]
MYYVVKVGRVKGIYRTWAECQAQVKGYPNAVFKKFPLKTQAEDFLRGDSLEHIKRDVAHGNLDIQVSNALKEKNYEIYTDGSYSENLYAWAFVVVYQGEVIHQDYGVGTDSEAVKTRNIAGELTAVMRACSWAKNKGLDKIIIRHDLQGVATWAKGEWKRNNQVTTKYYEFMKKYAPDFVKFQHVKGHSGNQYNDLADTLAKKAISEHLERLEME